MSGQLEDRHKQLGMLSTDLGPGSKPEKLRRKQIRNPRGPKPYIRNPNPHPETGGQPSPKLAPPGSAQCDENNLTAGKTWFFENGHM